MSYKPKTLTKYHLKTKNQSRENFRFRRHQELFTFHFPINQILMRSINSFKAFIFLSVLDISEHLFVYQ